MALTDRQLSSFLYVVQVVGGVFVAVFLAAYLAGLPTTAVMHSDPTVRLALTVLGIAFLVLTLAAIIVAAVVKRR